MKSIFSQSLRLTSIFDAVLQFTVRLLTMKMKVYGDNSDFQSIRLWL